MGGRGHGRQGPRGHAWRLPLAWCGGGVLLALPFLFDVLEPLAFAAAAPWCLALEASGRRAFRRGLLGGFTFVFVALSWLHVVTPFAPLAIAGYFGLYYGFGIACAAALRHRLGVPTWLALPAGVFVTESLSQHVTLFEVTWLFHGYVTWRHESLVQLAELGGISSLSLLVLASGGALAHALGHARSGGVGALRRRSAWLPFAVVVVLVALAAAFGLVRTRGLVLAEGPRLALVQGNVPQVVKMLPANADAIVQKHARMTLGVRERAPLAVVWPESTSNHRVERNPALQDFLGELARTMDAWLIVGGIGVNPDPTPPSNSLFLFSPEGRLAGRSDKRVLVPGGETLPVLGHVPVVNDALSDYLSRTMGFRPFLTAGEEAVVFRTGEWGLGPLICYGDLVPRLGEELLAAGAQVLVTSSNEAWFGSRELDQHLAMATVRCIETRLPMARATNNGITCLIDPIGRVTDSLRRDTEGVLVGRVAVVDTWRVPAWVRHAFEGLVTLVVVALAAVGEIRQRRRRGPESEAPAAA